MQAFWAFARQRAAVAGVAALLGAGVHLVTAQSPPPRTLEGLAQMLGRATGGVVAPDEIVWETSPGFLVESLRGRNLLFLAAPAAGKPRDVYRASVRVTLAGQPIGVRQLRNLTDTPLGDDVALKLQDGKAAFATVAYGRIQSVTVLELAGTRPMDRPSGVVDRFLLAINAFQTTGSLAGVGRTDIVLDLPARSVRMTFAPPRLHVDLGDRGRALEYDTQRRTLKGADGGQAYAARAVPQVHRAKPLVLWGVDTVRAEIGPAPIAWLEHQVFGAKDTVKRTTFAVFSSSAESVLKEPDKAAKRATLLSAAKLDDGAHAWPPPPIASLWKEVQLGEGEWQPVILPFLRQLPVPQGSVKAPPYFYKTFIRPDTKRPYAKVTLVAMDMRQLELGMQAGFEDPKPLTGPPGDGHLPREAGVAERVVATFNGAFKTTHGAYGMMVDRRVLIPPVKGAATVIVSESGETALGSWPEAGRIPEHITSFRQNLDPLVEDGVANPTGRYIWGWQLSGTSVMTQRTALCVTPGGHLYYAFGAEIDGPTLGKALQQAGCSYGIHLDMNPAHCGFVFTNIASLKDKEFSLKLADPEMKIPPDKFVRWSPKDFFYLLVREPTRRDESGVAWITDPGVQPPPAWLPGIFRGKVSIGSVDIELQSFERGRVAFHVRAGTKEPTAQDAPAAKTALTGPDTERVLAAINLGHTTEATRYGLAFDGKPSLPLRTGYATLVIGKETPLSIHLPGRGIQLEAAEEAVQLPLLAEEGQLMPHAREHGAMRLRSALCIAPGDRVVIATVEHDSSDTLTSALLRVGCKRVVELDRGSSHPAFVHRTGTPTPPMASYETSVLYALGRPMLPHAQRWKPEGSRPSTKPTGYDAPAPAVSSASTE
jgi:hypothetical protein